MVTRSTLRLALVGFIILISLSTLIGGCDRVTRRSPSGKPSQRLRSAKRDTSVVLVATIARALNHLPEEVVLDLAPPVPILDDSKSADSNEVLATLNVTPAVPDGPFNYLEVPKGNANFRTLGVQPEDVVRYFINYDQESLKHGFEELGYFELPVRRLDVNNQQNALIVEGGLNAPILFPARIEIWRFSDKRTNEIHIRLDRYFQSPKKRIAWEPSPDENALELLEERANQWLRNRKADPEWQPDPLLLTLPEQFRDSKTILARKISPIELSEGTFDKAEIRQLQQAIWLRDISHWAKGGSVDDLQRAETLFDWTVRNIQLDPPEGSRLVHQPWQALMYGHGTAEHRAWVFAELCRQQQLDVVMLAVVTGEKTDEKTDAPAQWWLPALLSDGQLYLFDTQLGVPIPGAELGSVATLDWFLKGLPGSAKVLEIGEFTYQPFGEVRVVEARVIATPLQLSRRAELLQAALEGDNFVVLAADCRVVEKELQKNQAISRVALWPLPFQLILDERSMDAKQRLLAAQRFLVFAQRPRLWKARVLHFQGNKDVPQEQRNDPLATPNLGHAQATRLYQDPHVRPPDALLRGIADAKREIYVRAKSDASYWIGLLSYDLGKYKPAEDWLARRTLEATPEGFWSPGARYNLARTYEARNELSEAIQLLRADDSPQRHGNLLRARRLEKAMEAQSATE